MLLACPSCEAEYDVPESRVKPGKMVRCARCGSEWMAAEAEAGPVDLEHANPPVDLETEASAAVSPAMAAHHPLGPTRSAPSSKAGLLGAWIATALVLAGAVTATIVWRDNIVRGWPPSSRILGAASYPMTRSAQSGDHGTK